MLEGSAVEKSRTLSDWATARDEGIHIVGDSVSLDVMRDFHQVQAPRIYAQRFKDEIGDDFYSSYGSDGHSKRFMEEAVFIYGTGFKRENNIEYWDELYLAIPEGESHGAFGHPFVIFRKDLSNEQFTITPCSVEGADQFLRRHGVLIPQDGEAVEV